MLLIEARVQSFEQELEQCDQVLWVRGGDVYVDIAERHGGRDGQAQRGRLAATSGRGEAVRRSGDERIY